MKANSFLKSMMIVLLIGISAPSVMAQKNIDKVLEEIEKRDDASVNSVVKRDPKTRKVISVVKSFSLTDDKIAKRLIEAFEKDEEYTVTAIKDMPKGRKDATRANFTFIFQKDNEKQTYTFNVGASGKINVSVIVKQGRPGKDFSLYFNNDLNGLDFEIQTIDEEQMKELQESIKKSMKELKKQYPIQIGTAI